MKHDWIIPDEALAMKDESGRPCKGFSHEIQCRECGAKFLWAWDHLFREAESWAYRNHKYSRDCNEEKIRRTYQL